MGYEGHTIGSNENPREYLKNYLSTAYTRCNFLDIKINSNNGYVLLESKENKTVFLVLFNWNFKKADNEVVFKTMHEFDGPYGDFKISKKVLDKLTSIETYTELGVETGYCEEFRNRVISQLNINKKTIPLDSFVRTTETIRFSNDISSNIFKKVERTGWNGRKMITKKMTACFDENMKQLCFVKIDLKKYEYEFI